MLPFGIKAYNRLFNQQVGIFFSNKNELLFIIEKVEMSVSVLKSSQVNLGKEGFDLNLKASQSVESVETSSLPPAHGSRLGLVIPGLLLILTIAVLDQTIVSTVVPTIVSKLGGAGYYAWVFSVYMIAIVVATPIAGRLSDIYGRKPLLAIGVGAFLLGSGLCGAASSMEMMIVFRGIQGLGAGMIIPIVFVTIIDLFPEEKRGKMNGLFGAVLGLASVFGPLAGAYFVDHWNWRWAFYMNMPIGIIAVLCFLLGFKEKERGSRPRGRLNLLNALLFTLAIITLMLGLEFWSREQALNSFRVIAFLVSAIVLCSVFILAERRSKQPLIPMDMFRNPVFSITMVLSVIVGVVMMACSTYIPLFIQGVTLESATNAGQTLTPMMLTLIIGSILSGLMVNKVTYRTMLGLGALIIGISMIMLYRLGTQSTHGAVILCMCVVGFGLGIMAAVLNLSSVHRLAPERHGMANSLVPFFRNMGSAIGIAIFGLIQTNLLQEKMAKFASPELQKSGAAVLLEVKQRAALPVQIVNQLTSALAGSIRVVFVGSLCLVVIGLLLIPFMGRSRVNLTGRSEEQAAETLSR
ncbi:EmrB/QacA subfamily drug resistance transporter [Paenibacillus baekrokdamisoli]|nr:EmrB/QacA subfamily drug resistance transporter [Paenibacillus baekrokdamisoli]